MITPGVARRTVIAAASVAVFASFLWDGAPPPLASPRPLVLQLFVTPDAWEAGEGRVLTDPIETFNRERATVGNRVIRIEPVAYDSGTVERLLYKLPSKAPDVWIPASRIWSQLLAYTHPDLVDYKPPTLIKSPQVLAVWDEVAEDLGPRLGWRDVLTFVRNPAEWSRRTGAAGSFRLAHTDPQRSTSGLAAAVSEFYLATGKTKDLDVGDVFRKVGTVHEIQQAIVHYGPTSGDILEQFACYGPSYASAVYIQETSLRRFNEGGYESETCPVVDPKPAAELHGYYPADGTFIAEYPCITMHPLDRGIRQEAANTFCDWLVGQLRRTADTVCVDYHYVVPGRPCGRPIPRKTLPVPTSGVLNEIRKLWPRYRRAADVILAVDASLSMEEHLDPIRREISTCLEDLVERDRLGLVVFGDQVRSAVPLGDWATTKPDVVDSIINGTAPEGASTRLLDGIERSLDELESERNGKRIAGIVVLTDGATEDPSSTSISSLGDRLRALRPPVRIFLVEMVSGSVDADVRSELLGASQGRAFVVRPTDDPHSPGTAIAELCSEVFSFF